MGKHSAPVRILRSRLFGASSRLEESPAYREPIFSFAPTSSGAIEYYRLSEEVIGRVREASRQTTAHRVRPMMSRRLWSLVRSQRGLPVVAADGRQLGHALTVLLTHASAVTAHGAPIAVSSDAVIG